MAIYNENISFISHELFNEDLQVYWPLNGNSFNSNGSYLKVLDDLFLRGGNKDFTIGCWFCLNDNNKNGHLIGKIQTSNSTIEYQLIFKPTGIFFNASIYTVSLLRTLNINEWNFVIAWNDSINKTINIQLNNEEISTFNYGPDILITTVGNFSIGGTALGDLFNGKISDVFKFDKILTLDERLQLYNGEIFKFLEFNNQSLSQANLFLDSNNTINFETSDYIGELELTINSDSNFDVSSIQTHNASLSFENSNKINTNFEAPFPWFTKNRAFKKVMKCGEDGIHRIGHL